MLKQKITQAPKTKISQTLRSWLPILQAKAWRGSEGVGW